MIYWLDLFGVAVFAVSGVIAAGKKRMDPVGVVTLGVVTAIGGGTLRDLLLGITPVFWVKNPVYIVVAVLVSLFVLLIINRIKFPYKTLVIADAFGLVLFAVLGVKQSMLLKHGIWISVIMGILSGVAGGAIRDILSNEIPLIFRKELYATVAFISGIIFYFATTIHVPTQIGMTVAILLGFGLRLFAIKKKLSLPKFDYLQQETPQ